MAFTDVIWTNGDTVTEVKLDQMIANDQHVREELNSRLLVTCARLYEETSPAPNSTPAVKWYADATLLDTIAITSASWTSYTSLNKAVSALSAGLHTIGVALCYYDVESDRATFRVEKIADLLFMSLWMRARTIPIGQAGAGNMQLRDITILGHRTSKSW